MPLPKMIIAIGFFASITTSLFASTQSLAISNQIGIYDEHAEDSYFEDELDDAGISPLQLPFACNKASAEQIGQINIGNHMYDNFMKKCWEATGGSRWCEELTRPNPSSRSIFFCTYGTNQPHRLIHPDTATWKYAFRAVNLIQDLEKSGISVRQIYNWWRPEPYNKNVSGAAGRHPFGTSVDVRFTSMSNMTSAHRLLCTWRAQGKLRAIGYYGSTGLHFGIGDGLANTWGKSCKESVR